MAKTIKEIADELGVSKTAVRKKIENLGLSEKLQTNGNRTEVDKGQEMLIKSAFSQKKTETKNKNKVSENQILFDMVSTLQNELEIKNEQIKELNARLAETTAALAAAQQTAQAAQALHAGTIQQQLPSGQTEQQQPESFWRRLFR